VAKFEFTSEYLTEGTEQRHSTSGRSIEPKSICRAVIYYMLLIQGLPRRGTDQGGAVVLTLLPYHIDTCGRKIQG
jgi:hypothetical protein